MVDIGLKDDMAYPISTIVDAFDDSDLTFEFEINHNSNAPSDILEGVENSSRVWGILGKVMQKK